LILGKNKRIEEILIELKWPLDIFEPLKNVLENPEKVLKVEPSEIPFEKYLTREEREK